MFGFYRNVFKWGVYICTFILACFLGDFLDHSLGFDGLFRPIALLLGAFLGWGVSWFEELATCVFGPKGE